MPSWACSDISAGDGRGVSRGLLETECSLAPPSTIFISYAHVKPCSRCGKRHAELVEPVVAYSAPLNVSSILKWYARAKNVYLRTPNCSPVI